MLRALLIAAAVCVAAGVLGRPADAARPAGWVHTATSSHFAVHYTSDPTLTGYTTQTQAADLAALGDRAYTAETGWGFPAPVDDGDGKVDVYIEDLSSLTGVEAFAQADNAATTSSGYIVFGVQSLGAADEGEIIAHELFHLIQFATWADPAASDFWLYEGSAQWAAAKVYGFPDDIAAGVGPSDLSLDCRDSIDGFQMCDADPYIDGGYSRWPFFQALAARYGTTFLQTVLANGASGMTATNALATAIASKGGALGDLYNDWAVEQMDGGYGISSLDALTPTAYASISTGAATASLAQMKVDVDHLTTRYLEFTRGDGSDAHACFAATLAINVEIPSGVTSRPSFVWPGSAPVALSISGSTASATVPWDTCNWSSTAGYLALPNDTTTVDAADFVVSSSITVDPNTPASATAPPSQGSIYGGQSDVSNAEVAPTISLFGPLLLKVPASAPLLRLIVESTDAGRIEATLGGVDLGSPSIRAGNNDLRFRIPKSLLSSLRRSSAAGADTLSLTPVSPSGAALGQPVTRRVVLAPVPKKKKK